MEGLADLLPLAFLILYFLLRGRKGQKPPAPAPNGSAPEARAPTPFEELVQRIETAANEGRLEKADRPLPAPLAPAPAPSRQTAGFHTAAGPFDSFASAGHEAHGFGTANPFSEPSFESRPPFARRPAEPADRMAYDPHGLRPPPTPAPADTSWAERLRDPSRAREAFVLKMIFERPGRRR